MHLASLGAGSPTPTQTLTPAGFYTTSGSAAPIPCLPGTFNSQLGQEICPSCQEGYYCLNQSTIVLTQCTRGHFCPEGERAKRSKASLEEDEHTRDGSREMAADIMATSTTKLTLFHSIRLARSVCFALPSLLKMRTISLRSAKAPRTHSGAPKPRSLTI
mgnify:CR=1 FL=1